MKLSIVVLVIQMAQVSGALSASDRPDSYPDFAGQFLHSVGEQLLAALVKNDENTVTAIFPAAFAGALRQYDRLAKTIDLSDWRGAVASKVAVAPILDVVQLSGYCILFSELHHNPALAHPVSQTWTSYLDKSTSESRDFLSFLAAAIAIDRKSVV